MRIRRREGTWRWAEVNGVPIDYQGRPAVLNFMADVTERLQAVEELQRRAYLDELTGLPNRRFFEEELARLDAPENLPLTVVFGDVNGLKRTNDTMGHRAGDELLCLAAAVMTEACRPGDVAARWGGDEFVMLLPRTDEMEAAALVADMRRRCAQEWVGSKALSIAFGWQTKRSPEETVDAVFRAAEEHMYRRKAGA